MMCWVSLEFRLLEGGKCSKHLFLSVISQGFSFNPTYGLSRSSIAFVIHSVDRSVFSRLIELKSADGRHLYRGRRNSKERRKRDNKGFDACPERLCGPGRYWELSESRIKWITQISRITESLLRGTFYRPPISIAFAMGILSHGIYYRLRFPLS